MDQELHVVDSVLGAGLAAGSQAIMAGNACNPRSRRPSRTSPEERMRIPIEMPKLGYDMESGKVAAWTRQVGDTVARGDVIAEIETEKSTVEMEAVAAGTLVEQTLGPGEEVPVGTVIGYLDDGS
jgi:biotin carboxyl carrier protein